MATNEPPPAPSQAKILVPPPHHCPTCGATVTVDSSGEGTNSYTPQSAGAIVHGSAADYAARLIAAGGRIAELEEEAAAARAQQEQLKKLGIEWRDGGWKWATIAGMNVTTIGVAGNAMIGTPLPDPAAVLAAVDAEKGAGAV